MSIRTLFIPSLLLLPDFDNGRLTSVHWIKYIVGQSIVVVSFDPDCLFMYIHPFVRERKKQWPTHSSGPCPPPVTTGTVNDFSSMLRKSIDGWIMAEGRTVICVCRRRRLLIPLFTIPALKLWPWSSISGIFWLVSVCTGEQRSKRRGYSEDNLKLKTSWIGDRIVVAEWWQTITRCTCSQWHKGIMVIIWITIEEEAVILKRIILSFEEWLLRMGRQPPYVLKLEL